MADLLAIVFHSDGTCALLSDSSAMERYRPRSHAGSVGSRTSARSGRSQASVSRAALQHSSSVPGIVNDDAVGASTMLPLGCATEATGSHRGARAASEAPSSQLCSACRCTRCGRSRRSSRCGTPGSERGIVSAPAPGGLSPGLGLDSTKATGLAFTQVGETMKPTLMPPSLLPEILELLSAG